MLRILVSAIICSAMLTGCAVSEPTAAPSNATGIPASSTTPATATPAAAATTDADVCRSLERTGKPFYPTFAQLMKNETLNIEPITLSAQLAALSTTGVAQGSNEIDGTSVINKASPDLREKITRLVRDADRLAQRFADAAQGAAVGPDVTDIVNSFTGALIACHQAGYPPSWFDPKALVG